MKKGSILGQYQPTNSLVHQLDSRLKITLIFYIVIILFFVRDFNGYLILLLFAFILVLLSRVSLISSFSAFRPILFLLLFTIFFQMFFTPGEVVFKLYFIKISKEGLTLSLYIALRLILLSTFTFILTSTTSTVEIAEGFQMLISPLKFLKFPSDDIALMISISLQFVPILFEEADRIMKAQVSRGAEFNKGNPIRRARSFLPLLLPLLLSSFDRADQLANAMEARGFVVGAKRTSYKERRFRKLDYYFTFIFISVSIVALSVGRFI